MANIINKDITSFVKDNFPKGEEITIRGLTLYFKESLGKSFRYETVKKRVLDMLEEGLLEECEGKVRGATKYKLVEE